RGGFEMVMLRMLAFRPVTQAITQASIPVNKPVTTPATTLATATPNHQKIPSKGGEWENVIQTLGLRGGIKQLADNCELKKHEGNSWYFNLQPQYKAVLTSSRKESLEKLLEKHCGASQTIFIHTDQTNTSTTQQVREEPQNYVAKEIEKEPFVVYMQENCAAKAKVINK
ncbi:DNA polymerase III subunit gamma/tau C-terminal domain-containing protein, partial [Thiotrichales bacterium HSG1]|nr:DNA polymerase III subunit gamma/tau C-terminal domain-containing protein [Thiotrichales bacterium HSG1]